MIENVIMAVAEVLNGTLMNIRLNLVSKVKVITLMFQEKVLILLLVLTTNPNLFYMRRMQ